MTTLFWFRQDLRLRDNPALTYACQQGNILPVYIDDITCPGEYRMGEASRWWLHNSLTSLDAQLDKQLQCFRGSPSDILIELVTRAGIKSVVWNRCYEPWQIARDNKIKQHLTDAGVEVKSFNGSLLWEPWDVLKADNTPYKVFTPYYRKGCLNRTSPRMPLPAPECIEFAQTNGCSDSVSSLGLLPDVTWYEKLPKSWQPGEQGAAQQMADFLNNRLAGYKVQRDRPDVLGTSNLSAHLHFGELSPNQIWHASAYSGENNPGDLNLDCFQSELGWREFSYYLLYHFPTLPEQNFNASFDGFEWREDADALKAWQQGQTGIPIVDAGMRELWETGHMHNRVRMIVASFLVKNLLIHWQQGQSWFWDCLLDADLASNSASWQWVAGSGADAAPYFRIFNPLLQGEKFDPQGNYVKRFCPELSALPDKYIHSPWTASEDILNQAGIELGVTYPEPIVDLKASRQRALDVYKNLKARNEERRLAG